MTVTVESGDRITEYILEEKVGEGGFGEVWKARHHIFDDELVAVKFPTDPLFIQSLRNEGATQQELDHPGIVETIGLDPWHEPPYFMMEYVTGESLRDHLQSQGKVSVPAGLAIMKQLLEALRYAHDRGVIHGDIKPENIFLTGAGPNRTGSNATSPEFGTVKIGDFGMARQTGLLDSAQKSLEASWTIDSGASEEPVIGGTYNYMAPEIRNGEGELTPEADLFSCGVVLYEMLMGMLPEGAFPNPSDQISSASPDLDRFVRNLLRPDPEQRVSSCQDALAALNGLRSETASPEAQNRDGMTAEGESEIPVASEVETPFEFRDGTTVSNLREFVEKCDEDRELALEQMRDGDLEKWFLNAGYSDLSQFVRERRTAGRVEDSDLEALLQQTGLVAPPQPELDVTELDLGTISRGDTRKDTVYLTNYGRGTIRASVSSETDPDWLRVEPEEIEGNDQPINVFVNTSELNPGSYEELVRVNTDREILSFTVRFVVSRNRLPLETSTKSFLFFSQESPYSAVRRIRNITDQTQDLRITSSADWVQVPGDQQIRIDPGETHDVAVRVQPSNADSATMSFLDVLQQFGFDSLVGKKAHLSLETGKDRVDIPVYLMTNRMLPGWFIGGFVLAFVLRFLPGLTGMVASITACGVFLSSWFWFSRRVHSAMVREHELQQVDETSILVDRLQNYLWSRQSMYLFIGALTGVLVSLVLTRGVP